MYSISVVPVTERSIKVEVGCIHPAPWDGSPLPSKSPVEWQPSSVMTGNSCPHDALVLLGSLLT